jgi:hypothetical protein
MTCNQNCQQGRTCECGFIVSPPDVPVDRWTILFLLLSGALCGSLLTVLCFLAGMKA